MYAINLPFGRKIFACSICGSQSTNIKDARKCEAFGMPETTDLRVGQEIELHFERYEKSRFAGISFQTQKWSIDSIYYAHERSFYLIISRSFHVLPPHTLMVRLTQPFGPSGFISKELPYQVLRLWEEGDFAKLRVAELVPDIERPGRIARAISRLFSTNPCP